MIRLGQIEYINCLPIYQALEEKEVHVEAEMVKGPPTKLNKMFLNGQLDVTPISSIEYAQNTEDCLILPNLSISADGKVMSILLFSKIPVTELDGKKVCLSSSSATSVALLKILLEHYYHVNVDFITMDPSLGDMLEAGDAALLIGDDAMNAHSKLIGENNEAIIVTDLGEVWKQFTGERMIYALWVIRKDFAKKYPERAYQISDALISSSQWGLDNVEKLVGIVKKKYKFKVSYAREYFNTIVYDFTEEAQRALLTFYDYAYKSGLIEERVHLEIWGENQDDEDSRYS